jgi:3-phenylpropionate/trans-cinnamate dioxygenase ferredoxin reductase component
VLRPPQHRVAYSAAERILENGSKHLNKPMPGIVVIGAGQAGSSLVAKLRALGYSGALMLIGAEPVAPYQRPHLSKGYLLGEMEVQRLLLRPAGFYAEQAITLLLGQKVTAIDRHAQTVTMERVTLAYDQLVLTTGSVPRRLPAAVGGDLQGVYVIRGIADVEAVAPEFVNGRRVLIVGGGYIGLEAAAVAAKSALQVTIIEPAPRILQRVAAPEVSDCFRALHMSHGVVIHEGVGVERLCGEGRRVTSALLTDGRKIATDFVIAGIGVTPDIALAEAAGLAVENGIRTDALGRTSDPRIWAAGDCASFPWRGGRLRLESVGNAIDHAETVAANMLGAGAPYAARPWFWSDQFDAKLQIAGLNIGYDRTVLRKGLGDGVSVWYFSEDRLLAVDAINDSRAYMVGKRLIEMGKTVDPSLLADPQTELKALLRA